MNKRIGIFSDTHGNLQALEAILGEFRKRELDEIYHLGDVICMGPNPKECMDIIFGSKDIRCVRGNHDNDYLINFTAKRGFSHVSVEHKEFMYKEAGDEYRKVIEKLPYIIEENYFGLKVAYTHYARHYAEDLGREVFYVIEKNPTPERFDEMFKDIDADVIFFGHNHSPISMKGKKKLYIDVGSVGCHRYDYARGVILNVSPEMYFVEKVHVPYDRKAMEKTLADKKVPGIEEMMNYYFAGN